MEGELHWYFKYSMLMVCVVKMSYLSLPESIIDSGHKHITVFIELDIAWRLQGK